MKTRVIAAAAFMAALLLLSGCDGGKRAVVNGELEGAADSSVVVSRLDLNRITVVDTVKTDKEGRFKCKESVEKGDPQFYYLSYGGRNFASLVLQAGDRISISADTLGRCTVEGSDESVLLQEAENRFARSLKSMDSLNVLLENATDEGEISSLRRQMGSVYVNQKRFALKHSVSNPRSISSVTVFYQKFGTLPVFNDVRDAIVFQNVYDSIKTVYPDSKYVAALADEIKTRKKSLELQNRLDMAQTVNFPDIELPDINARTRRLSDLEGKVIVLFFWSGSQTDHKLFNNDLKPLYGKYHDRGLEIYQVSLDVDKAAWATVVKAQEIPWITVCDGMGGSSPSVSAYNVTQIPTLFVIGRDGSFKGRDIYDADKLGRLVESLL